MPDEKKRILVLDDDENIAKTLAYILKRLGYEVIWTVEHEFFFKNIKDWHPEFVFTDLMMPHMDGVEVIEYLADIRTDAKIVICSGAHPRVLNAAKLSVEEHGLLFAGVLHKPFKSENVRKLLEDSNFLTTGKKRKQETNFANTLQADDLRLALERKEIIINLQPKVFCSNEMLAGFEVLARWNHAEFGAVNPELFIALAEENDLIDTLTMQVFSQALHWLTGSLKIIDEPHNLVGLETLLSNLVISINISARSLSNKQLFIDLGNQCAAMNVSASRIILELTETSAMIDPLVSLDILTRLRMQGFMLSIDDFGTGYSSMKQLVRQPFSEIKIDKSFVMSALTNSESMTITRSIIELGQSLGLSTTAEGVEDLETLHTLRDIGCELGQGYFISRPLSVDKVSEWVVSHALKCEELRLKELVDLELLDTETEDRFDRHTQFAKEYFNVPFALVSLVASNRQWFKSNTGIAGEGSDRAESFCTHTIAGNDVFQILDARQHPIFSQYKSVRSEPFIRFYAGVPLRGPRGHHVGTFCIIDTMPRKLSSEQVEKLRSLAALVEVELQLTGAASADKVTGVLNRNGLKSRSREMLMYAYKLAIPVAELTLKIDNLDDINEKYDYLTGNKVLRTVATALSNVVRNSDLVGRYSGNCFKAFLLDVPNERVEFVTSRLHKRINEENLLSDSYQIQCSLNVSAALKIELLSNDIL